MTGTSLQVIDMSLSIENIDSYISKVHQIPMLTLEEEQDLAHRTFHHGDLEAARRMIMSHLRFVVRIAKGFSGYGLALADLIQEGNIGLMKAVKRFDPAVGVRLVSFAVHWVKAEIHEFILKNWRIVKIATTKAQRKLFFNLRNSKKRLGWFTNEEVDAVAKDLGVTPKDVLQMETRMHSSDASFDLPVTSSNEQTVTLAPSEYLEDTQADPALLSENSNLEAHNQFHLVQAMGQLDERSQDILRLRWLSDKKATLHALADKYQVSAERIRQLEKNAMKKLKQALVSAMET